MDKLFVWCVDVGAERFWFAAYNEAHVRQLWTALCDEWGVDKAERSGTIRKVTGGELDTLTVSDDGGEPKCSMREAINGPGFIAGTVY